MKKTLVILKREYLTRVRTKAFVIVTPLTPFLLGALTILPTFLAMQSGGERVVTVLDQSGNPDLFDAIKSRLGGPSETPGDGEEKKFKPIRFSLTRVVVPAGQSLDDDYIRAQTAETEKDPNKGVLLLPLGILEDSQPKYYAKNPSDFSISQVEKAVSGAIQEQRLVGSIPKDKIKGYLKSVELKTNRIENGKITEESALPGVIVAYVMLFFIYITILLYGLMVMRGVIEEKQSRIVEVIASSIKPAQMMMGKVIGIGLVGLTQYAIWVTSAAAISAIGASLASPKGVSMPKIPISLLIYFVVFFLLGYFLYATLYAMVGAMVSTEEEAQQAQMPVTLLIIVPMLLFGMVLSNPSSGVSIGLSMVPFFAPTLMMMRISLVNPPMWQVLGAIGGMVLAILGAVWLAGRIYRVGILMYGKRPSIAELGRWLRYT